MFKYCSFFIFLIAVSSCQTPGTPFILMNREKRCTIVVDLDKFENAESLNRAWLDESRNDVEPSAATKVLAALELRQYLANCLDIGESEIPIVDDNTMEQGTVILLSQPTDKNAFPDIQKRLRRRWRNGSDQGLRLDSFNRKAGDILSLSGSSAVGVLYATYEFLYQLGVRWYVPGKAGEYIPELKEIVVKPQSDYMEPAFSLRGYDFELTSNQMYEFADADDSDSFAFITWMARNRLNCSGKSSLKNKWLQQRGIRQAVRLPRPLGERFCLGYPDGLEAYKKEIINFFQQENLIGVVPPLKWCNCELCVHFGNNSDKTIALLLQLQASLSKQPRSAVYGYCNPEPPSRPWSEEQNISDIAVFINLFPRCYSSALCDPTSSNMEICVQLDQWCSGKYLPKNVVNVTEKYNSKYFDGLPVVFDTILAEDLPAYHRFGVAGIVYDDPGHHLMGVPGWLNYSSAQLAYKADIPVDSLRTQFFAQYYTGVSELMQTYYIVLEEAMANLTAWRYHLPYRIKQIAEDSSGTHRQKISRINTAIAQIMGQCAGATDWERSYQLIHDARHVVDEALAQEVTDLVLDRLIGDEYQLRYAEMVIQLHDHMMRLCQLGEDEPEMRQENLIRLYDVINRLKQYEVKNSGREPQNGYQASGLEDVVNWLLGHNQSYPYENIYRYR